MTVLVVDDLEQNRYQLEVLLRAHGHEVVCTSNGSEALAAARSSPPDLVVSDILMPVMDGFSLCREWGMDERLRDIPFVFYTATYTDERDRELAMSLGAARFMVKPVEPDEFMQAIREVMVEARRSVAAPPRGPGGPGETGYLQQYNAALIRKLEDKMQQLERANHALEEDLAARRRAEEALQKLGTRLAQMEKLESIGRLAGGVAHDFNNALSVIIGHAELALKEAAQGHPLRSNLVTIRDAAMRSANLTRQLLAFARRQTIAPRVLQLNDAVAGMLSMLQRLIGEDIQLAWLPGAALWPVKMDPVQIDQILVNLVVNARDAIGGVGKITVETRNAQVDEVLASQTPGVVPGEYVMMGVTDNGCGMEKAVLEHLFEPFFTTKGVGHGTGLGLATVFGIVQQNLGCLSVSSTPGKGAVFKIYLPKAPGALPDAEIVEALREPQGKGETVLLVEDDPAILEVETYLLTDLGYLVLGAGSPEQALKIAREAAGKNPIGLVITDVIMPAMNGKDLADHLVRLQPGLKCLFVSGYTADVIAHRGVLNEGVRFLQKPFSRVDLAVTVRQALDS